MEKINSQREELIKGLESLCSEMGIKPKEEWRAASQRPKDSYFLRNLTDTYYGLLGDFLDNKIEKNKVINALDIICRRMETLDLRFTTHSKHLNEPKPTGYNFDREMGKASCYAQHVIGSAICTGDEESVRAIETSLGVILSEKNVPLAITNLRNCYTTYSSSPLIEMTKLIVDMVGDEDALLQLEILGLSRPRNSSQEFDLAIIEKAREYSIDSRSLKQFVGYVSKLTNKSLSQEKLLERIKKYKPKR